jgi:hypothetical protein
MKTNKLLMFVVTIAIIVSLNPTMASANGHGGGHGYGHGNVSIGIGIGFPIYGGRMQLLGRAGLLSVLSLLSQSCLCPAAILSARSCCPARRGGSSCCRCHTCCCCQGRCDYVVCECDEFKRFYHASANQAYGQCLGWAQRRTVSVVSYRRTT